MNNIKYFVITLLILVIIISCSISPEIVEKAELTPQIKYLDSPSEVKVKSDYEGNKIDLEWCEVEGATHYEVEYESVVDYLSGKEMKKYITLSPSFSLSSFLSSSDKRYVFRVRAGKKNDDGVLYSRYTDLKEGALIDDFTVSFVIRDGVLNFYSSTTKSSSILHSGDIAESKVSIYEGDRELLSGKRKVEPGEIITLKSVLLVDGNVIKEKTNTITVETSLVPNGVSSISTTVNEKRRIDVTFISPGINKGLESTEILFRLERREINGGEWEEIKNEDDEYFSVSSDVDTKSEFSFTISDTNALNGLDYSYRVFTVYKTLDGDEYIYYEDENPIETDKAYVADERVKSFYLYSVTEPKELDDGTYEVKVKLNWEIYHYLPSSYSFVIERKVVGEEDSPLNKIIDDISSETLAYTDRIILTKEEKRDPKTFIYSIAIKDDEGEMYLPTLLSDNEGNNKNVEIVGEELVDIIGSFNVSSSLNNKIKLTWTNRDDYSEYDGFDKNKVTFSIYRDNGDGYSLITENIPYGTNVYYDSVSDDIVHNYMIKAFYNEDDKDERDYEYVRNYPFSNIASGKRLDKVKKLAASYNEYNDGIALSWEVVKDAVGYRIRVSIGEEEKEYTTEKEGCYFIDDPNIMEGEVKIWISVIDEDGEIGDESEDVIGKVLSPITPRVTNGDKFIKVEWDKEENVDKYLLTVYSSEDIKESVDSVLYNKNDVMEYILSSFDLDGKNIPDDPLSSTYYFSVTPYNKDIFPKEERRVEGSWVLPPLGVKATKAMYKDKIDVTWNPVVGASAYAVESRKIGEEEWKRNTVFSTSFSQYDPEEKYEDRVATIMDAKVGPYSTVGDDSVGYALLPSQEVEGRDEGDGIYSITFKGVEGADSYMLKIPYWENRRIDITPEILSDPTKKTFGFIDGDLKYNNGYYTYYFKKSDLTHSVSLSMDFYSVNSAIDGYENYSKPKEVNIVADSLNEREVVNLALYTLRQIMEEIDAAFEGDWWARTGTLSGENNARTYLSDDSKIEAKSSYGKYWGDATQRLGYIKVTDFSFDNVTIQKADIVPKAENGGEAGYLGTDPFSSIDSGSLDICFPYGLGVYNVQFFSFKNDLSSGSARVTKDGVSVDVNATDLKTVLLR